MINQKIIQKAALFMICLMISLPFYSASALAAITTYSVNKDNVRDYRATNDQTTVVAEIGGSIGSSSDVRLITNQNVGFQQCAFNDTLQKSVCTYRFPQGNSPPGSFSYTASYLGESAIGTITVDSIAPNVTMSPPTLGQNISVTYSVVERAVTGTNRCSGIRTIEFTLGGLVVKTLSLNHLPDTQCNYAPVAESVSAPSTNNIEKSFCVRVTDNVGNVGETCRGIVVDKEIPIASNAVATTSTGTPINYISSSTGPLSAGIQFSLSERLMTAGGVRADASEFTNRDDQKQNQKNIIGSCTPTNCSGSCMCTIPNVIVNLPQGGNPVLKLSIVDAAGNIAEQSLPTTIRVDNTAPVVSNFIAKKCSNGVNAIGKDQNFITATIQDSESGLAGKKIYLDLSAANPNAPRVFPNSCAKSGASWACTWGVFSVQDSVADGVQLPISIVNPSQDDAGNLFTYSTSLFYDKNQPVYHPGNLSMRAATNVAFGAEIAAFPTTGGTVQFTFTVEDDLPVTVSANLSEISPYAQKNATCSGVGRQTCVISEIGPLYGPKNINIPVTFTDCVGNSFTAQVPITIRDLETTEQNYWAYNLKAVERLSIDKQVLSIMSQKAYFPLELSSFQGAEPIVQSLESCTPASALDYFVTSPISGTKKPDLVGAPGVTPYVRFNVERQADPPASLPVTCIFKTISRTAAGAISQPEYDNVTFELKFTQTRFGSIDSEVKKKADEVRNSPLVQGKLIGQIDKVIGYARTGCGIWNAYNLLSGAIATIGTILGVLEGTPAAGASKAGRAASTASSAGTAGIGSTISTLCDYVACNKTPFSDKEFVKKWLEILNKYLTFTGGLEKGVSKVTGANAEDLKNLQNKYNPESGKFEGAINYKDSLILSTVSLCLPGVLYNLQKARQIECTYVYCLENQVTQGVPIYYCEVLRASGWCKFVWGEIFQVVPFARFIDALLDYFKKLYTDPIFLLSTVLATVCTPAPGDTPSSLCRLFQAGIQLTSAAKSLYDYATNWEKSWTPSADMCAAIFKEN